ncbi:MAG: TIGR03915 family putative DNA repair protein [Saccharofermentanales bacterium]
MFYVYDGSFEGFLSAVTTLFRNERLSEADSPELSGICPDTGIIPLFPHIYTDHIEGVFDRFGTYISDNFGTPMLDCIYRAFLSGMPGTDDAIVAYIRLARRIRKDPIDMLYVDCVKSVAEAAKRTGREAHRYMGLLRFRKLRIPSHSGSPASCAVNSMQHREPGEAYYAEFEPGTDCLPLLAEHFADRFTNRPFIIADRTRSRCLLHQSAGEWTIIDAEPDFFRALSTDTIYEELWQRYFKCLAIPERINPGLQSSNMPKKYWKHLVESPGRAGQSMNGIDYIQ